MTCQERQFKTDMLAALRGYLSDGANRPAALMARYRDAVARLERELEIV